MQFGSDDDADSSQVEDRRGQSFGGPIMLGGGGLGLVGVVAYVIIRLLGGNVVVGNGGGGPIAPPAPYEQPQAAPNESLGGSCQGVTSTSDPAKFISCVVSNVQHFWQKRFAADNQPYRTAHLVLFSDATASGCGTASA